MSTATDTTAKPAAQGYDPHSVFVIINPNQPPVPGELDFLAVTGDEFEIKPGRDGTTPFVFLDVPAYLRRHLGEYRGGWAAWLEEWEAEPWPAIFYFNDLSDDPTGADPDAGLPVEVAIYLGVWLWERILADVVAQHGGKPDDFQVSFAWADWMVDHIAAVVPEVDPRRPVPDNHWLVTHPAQQELVTRVAAGEAG